MNKADLFAFRNKELSSYYTEVLGSSGRLRVESAGVPEQTGQRLAIGARPVGRDDYELVVRVQNKAGRAFRWAEELTQRVHAEFGSQQRVDLAVIKRITVPPQIAVAEQGSEGSFGADRVRPLAPGYSIGHPDGPPGTIGLIARSSDAVVAISCNHVLARVNTADPGDHLYQPGPPDAPRDTRNRIGTLDHYRELTKSGANQIDAACCILHDADEDLVPEENTIPAGSGAPDAGQAFAAVVDPFELDLDRPVAKIGRSTGYTSEPVANVAIGVNDVTIQFPGFGNCRFDDMIEIEWSSAARPFAKPGDSGSAVYQEGTRNVFGFHMASGEIERTENHKKRLVHVSYACPAAKVMKAYNLHLL